MEEVTPTKLPDDYTIRLVDLPISVGGRISECPDGHIDVYINARMSRDGQYRAADHEFDHWRNDDLHNGLDIRLVEGRDAHKLPPIFRARDLLPKAAEAQPEPEPEAEACGPLPDIPMPARRPQIITPWQRHVLDGCIAEMDALFGLNPICVYD
ncbi:MAG: hypothetical protein Q4C10_07245 [Clostridia bacterium]|nr:hypothetical protein [Clostridia bacterium]